MKRTTTLSAGQRMLASLGLLSIVLISWASAQPVERRMTAAMRLRAMAAWAVIELVTGIGWCVDRLAGIDRDQGATASLAAPMHPRT